MRTPIANTRPVGDKRQRGLGLVEMMVAMTIGIVMLLGLATVFSAMRSTSISTQQLSAVQNSQNMAMFFLQTAVSGAGYNPTPQTTVAITQFPSCTLVGANCQFLPTFPCPAGATSPSPCTSTNPSVIPVSFTAAGVTLLGSGSGTTANPDILSVRFTASGTSQPQQGCSSAPSQAANANHIFTDSFGYLVSNGVGYLGCVETDETAGTQTVVDLIAGVSSMVVLYGVDATGSGSVTQYMTGDQVTAGGFWVTGVKTVQATLSFPNPVQNTGFATVQIMETIPYMANI